MIIRQRLGALLCLVLGTVLLTTGLGGGGDAVAGTAAPTCQVPSEASAGLIFPTCPTGTITVDETTIDVPGATATPPADGWIVVVTSDNCTDPNGNGVNVTLTIPDNGSDTTPSEPGLFVYADPNHTTPCQYTLTPQDVAGFTGVLVPPSPVVIAFDGENGSTTVALTETPAAPTSSQPVSSPPAPPSLTPPPSLTDSASLSVAASSSTVVTTSPAVAPTTAALAETGTRTRVGLTLWAGVALLALGLVLLLTGARPKPGTHRAD